ncbi:hypothetical protein DFAR_3180017 [Desulfarculales bacterium]
MVLFRRFLREYGGDHNNIAEVIYDMSPAFLAAIGESVPSANVTVDWFHVSNFSPLYGPPSGASPTSPAMP